MHHLTTEEQERRAYMAGHIETADLLGRIDDAHRALGEEAAMQAEIDDMRDKLDAMQQGLDDVGCRLHDARAMLELSNDKVKTYRAALMAVESEVPAHVRQFIREVLA